MDDDVESDIPAESVDSGRADRARLVGGDPKTDIALLKIEAEGLQVGEPVMARRLRDEPTSEDR